MSKEKIDFEDGHKIICPTCGSPAVRHRMPSGTTYLTSVIEESLGAYFKDRDDVDDLLRDRLRRAEKIIVDLRQELIKKK